MPIFMKAGSIEGAVAAASHKGWVEIDSCGFEVKFCEDDVRKSLSEGAPVPKLDSFDVEKSSADRSGPAFMQWMVDGTTLDMVQIDVCSDTSMDGWRCSIRYTLKKVVLVDYGMKVNDGEKGTFTITMKMDCEDLSVECISYDKKTEEKTRATTTIHKPQQ